MQGDGKINVEYEGNEEKFRIQSDEVFGDLETGLSLWTCTVTTMSPCLFFIIPKVVILQLLHMYPRSNYILKDLFNSAVNEIRRTNFISQTENYVWDQPDFKLR